MKNAEMKQMIKKGIRTRRFQDISELLFATYRILDSFAPVVEHAKEMTDEFNDFPNDQNKVCMEMARNNVLIGAHKLAERLCELYAGLSIRSKKMFTFKEFSEVVGENLCGMLKENCENG